jgi:predicted NAD/FAD-dependent oxidoreductase
MSSSPSPVDVLVIGAGLSGLLAAATLQAAGKRVLVLDKARGVGGRLATRRLDPHTGDHGAQFFTAHDPRFKECVAAWEKAGVITRWSTGFTAPDGTFRDNGVPRYRGVPGMTGIAKHLAHGLDVRTEARVARLQTTSGVWTAILENGTRHEAHAIVLTPPVPQSLALLKAGEVSLPEPAGSELGQIDYAPCLTLLAELDGPSRIPEPGGMWMSGEPLLWIADNRKKGVSTGPETLVTIHGGQEFSREQWDAPEATATAALLEAAKPWLGSEAKRTHLHRWRYSVPLRVYPEPCLVLDAPALLAFAGDAFGGPRIEAAALSGLAAADALLKRLTAKAQPTAG